MSVRQSTDVRYASTADVARYVRGYPSLTAGRDFPSAADAEPEQPSAADVEQFIQKWSSRFDRRTGQSFRPNQILDETHDHQRLYYWLSGHPINVLKRNIVTPLDASKGDKLEVWTGNKWEDWVASDTRTEGRDEDYWVDEAVGIIYVYERAILRPHPKFRLSYRYGGKDSDGDGVADYVPGDVRDAVAARAAADILNTDVYGTAVPGNNDSDGASVRDSVEDWKEEYDAVVSDYKKVRWV